jgi:KaiC/GvpD/RAD55 family RecA-like ATPase
LFIGIPLSKHNGLTSTRAFTSLAWVWKRHSLLVTKGANEAWLTVIITVTISFANVTLSVLSTLNNFVFDGIVFIRRRIFGRRWRRRRRRRILGRQHRRWVTIHLVGIGAIV